MEESLIQLTGFGVVGVIGGKLFNTFMKERAEERKIALKNQQEDRELYRQSVETFTNVTQTFANSFNELSSDLNEIKEDVNKIIEKVGA